MYYQQQHHQMQHAHHLLAQQQQQMGGGGGHYNGMMGGGGNVNAMYLAAQQQQAAAAAAAAAAQQQQNLVAQQAAAAMAAQQQLLSAPNSGLGLGNAQINSNMMMSPQNSGLTGGNSLVHGGGNAVMNNGYPHNLPEGGILPGPTPLPSVSKSSIIRDVWAENLEEEFAIIRELIVDYPFVAMDTEFPGVVARPVGSFKLPHEFYYATLRYNVNLLKIIQLGISLLNERGEVPEGCCTWQFNFRFNLAEDTFAQDSIELLKTGGINFDNFCDHGIEITRFSELLYSSGLVLNPEVRWLAFHAGYDFGYLMRGLLNQPLPDKEEDFTAIFHQLFPSVFDIKYILRQTDIMHSAGLDFLADSLSVRRLGTAHQAGSDSLLTGHSFFKLLRDRLNRQMPYHANGILYGLREDAAASNGAAAHNGSSGMTPSTPPTATPYTPGGSAAGQFPSTPLMNIVLHGGNRDAKIHHNSK